LALITVPGGTYTPQQLFLIPNATNQMFFAEAGSACKAD